MSFIQSSHHSVDCIDLFVTLQNPLSSSKLCYQQAEVYYLQLKSNPTYFLSYHLTAFEHTVSIPLRQFILTLLHTHLLNPPTLYSSIPPNSRNHLQKFLINHFTHEASLIILRCISTLLCSIYQISDVDNEVTITLQNYTIKYLTTPTHHSIAHNIITSLIPFLPPSSTISFMNSLLPIITNSLVKPDYANTPLLIYVYSTCFLRCFESYGNSQFHQIYLLFQHILPQIITTSINLFQSTKNSSLLSSLLDIIHTIDQLDLLQQIVLFSFNLFKISTNIEDILTTLEILTTIFETQPTIFLLNNTNHYSLYEILFYYISNYNTFDTSYIDINEFEFNFNDFPFCDDDPLYYSSIGSLQRILTLDDPSFFQNFFQKQVSNLTKYNQHTFLHALFIYQQIFLPFIDPHQLQTLSNYDNPQQQLFLLHIISTYLSYKQFQSKNCTTTLLSMILSLLSDKQHIVISCACDLVITLISTISPSLIKPHINSIINELFPLIQTIHKAKVFHSLSNIIHLLPNQILQQTDHIINIICTFLSNTEVKKTENEIGRAVELLSNILYYYNKSGSGDYVISNEIIKLTSHLIQNQTPISSSVFSFIETSFTKLIHDNYFIQNGISVVMPLILARSSLAIPQQPTEFPESFEQQLIIEQKCNAISVISTLATDLKKSFEPFVSSCSDVVFLLLQNACNHDVCTVAAQCAVSLLYTTIPITYDIINILINVIVNQTSPTFLTSIFSSLQDAIKYYSKLSHNQLQILFQTLSKLLSESFERLTNLLSSTYNSFDSVEFIEAEGAFNISFRSLLSYVMDISCDMYYTFFEKLMLPIITNVIETNNYSECITFAQGIMVIVVAYGKNKQFIHEVVNQLFELYESDNIDVKIEILENFGVLSEVEEFKQYIPRLNELLLHIVQQQDNERLFEMAICTYGKCIINHSSYFQSNVVMDWIYTLPIGCHNDEVLWCLFVVIQKFIFDNYFTNI